MTRDQRFFLGFASAWREKYTPELTKMIIASDPHAPDGVRANGTPSNVTRSPRHSVARTATPWSTAATRRL
jgi:predicted metalloendopeptidase